MAARYMLDTDICIYTVNQQPGFKNVLRRLSECIYNQVVISAITAAELRYGAAKSRFRKANTARLEEFLRQFEILPFDDSAAASYGAIRAALEAKGKVIGPFDLLIAAHAGSQGMVLVTHNVREFSRVAGLDVQDWTS